eukprot:SAG11_NODE_31_length_23119_cov_102.800608_3_plen_1109_part_00
MVHTARTVGARSYGSVEGAAAFRRTVSTQRSHLVPLLAVGVLLVGASLVVPSSEGGALAVKAFLAAVAGFFGMADKQPIKSDVDAREFSFVTLPNGLEALLVSDPTTDEAAAAMDVGFGSWDEPEDIPGLAHFCEHMSFMGSAKYPDTNAYGDWIANNGGGTNAYTSSENTNYYFGVQPEALETTLDRFAQFFIEPLFSSENVYKEMSAVNSENENDRNKDGWRVQQVLSDTANPTHPAHRATVGSIGTLNRTDTRDRLLEWHSKYYVASAMKLVVLGRESTDELEQMVQTYFTPVPAGEKEEHAWTLDTSPESEAYPDELTGTLVRVQTMVSTQEIAIHWALPTRLTGGVDLSKEYRKSPLGYLGLVFSDDSEGSLSSTLKAKGLCDGISASHEVNSANSMFTVSGTLTAAGLANYGEVVGIVFDYISFLREQDPATLQAGWHQVHDLASVEFRYQEPETSPDYCSGLAADLQSIDAEDILGSPTNFEWGGELASQILASLTPQRAMVHLLSDTFPEAELTEVEPWWLTKYSREPLPEPVLSRINVNAGEEFKLMPENTLLARDLDLLPPPEPPQSEALRPELLRYSSADPSAPDVQVWWRQESDAIPTVLIQAVWFSDSSFETATSSAMTKLYAMVVDESMTSFRNMASLAGFSCKIAPVDQAGLMLSVVGYSDPEKLQLFLGMILDHMHQPRITSERFDDLLSLVRQEAEGFRVWQAYEQAGYYDDILSGLQRVTIEQTQQELARNITLGQLMDFIPVLLQTGEDGAGLALQMMVHGNTDREMTLGFADKLSSLGADLPGPSASAAAPAAAVPPAAAGNASANVTAPIAAESAGKQRIIPPTLPVKLNSGDKLAFQTQSMSDQDENNAVRSTFQFGRVAVSFQPDVEETAAEAEAARDATRRRVVLQLVDSFMGGGNVGGAFFEQLRSVEQLGYIVGDSPSITAAIGSLTFVVQGPDKDAAFMDSRINEFITTFYNSTILGLSEQKFNQSRAVLKKEYLAKAVTISDRSSRLWKPISEQSYHFTRKDLALELIDTLTIEDIQEAYRVNLIDSATMRHLTVQVFGAKSDITPSETTVGGASQTIIEGQTDVSLLEHPGMTLERWPS